MKRSGRFNRILTCACILCSLQVLTASIHDQPEATVIIIYDEEQTKDGGGGELANSSDEVDIVTAPTSTNFTFMLYSAFASFDSVTKIWRNIAKIHYDTKQKQEILLLFSFSPYSNFLMKSLKSIGIGGCLAGDGVSFRPTCKNEDSSRFEIEIYDFGSSISELVFFLFCIYLFLCFHFIIYVSQGRI